MPFATWRSPEEKYGRSNSKARGRMCGIRKFSRNLIGCRGSRVGCFGEMQAARLPLQQSRFSDALFQFDGFLSLLHDRLEMRMVAQRIPPWMQAQLAIGNRAIKRQEFVELLDCEVFFANPGVDDCKISQYFLPGHRILCYRQKLSGPPSLAQGFFLATEASVNHPDETQTFRILWLIA